ncbi:lyase family protein, partial [Symbiopectobacterium sp.]|uniref:lyase family protein n=1 Tax=Symbiopectobacterium sp. TaxID=2952789 RepID=UPI003F38978B
MSDNIRIEEDLLGTREVPADAYYGIHTLRAIENFYISNHKISDIPEFVRGMVMVKKAAALANRELKTIPRPIADTIIRACDEVLNNGKCMDQFPVDVYQGGAGTSVNMNTNEVLANIGLELMGHNKGEYQYLNPNDHLNKCQSTNDAYPTGFRIAVYSAILTLVEAITQLADG